MDKSLFKETQQFRQWWNILWIMLTTVPVGIFSVYSVIQQVFRGIPVGDKPAPNVVLLLIPIFLVVFLIVYFNLKLELKIDEIGIHYRFSPIQWKTKTILREEIMRYEIRKYSAIFDYGGRGLRKGFGRKWGRGYIVSGNQGLQLYLLGGEKILFGTQRPQAIMYAMDELMKNKQQK